VNPETNIMDAPTTDNSLATMPFRKTKVDGVRDILCLPDRKRVICSYDGSFRVRDLETGTQVGEYWEDKDEEVRTIVLSPDGKKVASGSWDGAVKLWNVDTGKVIKTWTGHTAKVASVNWSPDGGRVVSGSSDGTFRVWDVESGKWSNQRREIRVGWLLLTRCQDDCHRRAYGLARSLECQLRRIAQNTRGSILVPGMDLGTIEIRHSHEDWRNIRLQSLHEPAHDSEIILERK
jgi:WD40 repeat protein